MTDVDPHFLYTPIPEVLRRDPEALRWAESLQQFGLTLWERTGGGADTVEATSDSTDANTQSITTLDGRLDTAESEIDTLQSDLAAVKSGTPDWTVVNASTDRSIDANAAAGAISSPPTQAEVEALRDAVLGHADELATLANDLINKGVLG